LGCERATGSEQRAIARRLAKATKEAMTMRMEWLRAGDSSPACWACFIVFDGHVDVLAVIGPKERIDRSMSPDAARALWADLRQRGWYRASEVEINHHQMSHRRLRGIAYG